MSQPPLLDIQNLVKRFGALLATDHVSLQVFPNEIHALRIGPAGCEFLAFSSGERGGKDYESDTFRVDSIID